MFTHLICSVFAHSICRVFAHLIYRVFVNSICRVFAHLHDCVFAASPIKSEEGGKKMRNTKVNVAFIKNVVQLHTKKSDEEE